MQVHGQVRARPVLSTYACGCAEHQCSGGFCPGDGCTGAERQWCQALGQFCSLHQCQRYPTSYPVHTGDFNGDGKTDVVTWSPNANGGWASWAALELSTDTGFTSTTWSATTPQHARNGGADNIYQSVAADFDGNGKTDLATITQNGGGGWASWVAVELSTGSGFTSTAWTTPTPQHIRNGGATRDHRLLTGDFDANRTTDLAVISPDGGGGWASWLSVDRGDGRALGFCLQRRISRITSLSAAATSAGAIRF